MLDMIDLMGKRRDVNDRETPPEVYIVKREMISILESWLM